MRGTRSRITSLLVGMALAATVVAGTVTVSTGTATAATNDCLAVPGVSVRSSGGQCTRWVVPFPNRSTLVPLAEVPPNAVPARQLAPGEPAPSPFVNPITVPVYIPSGSGWASVIHPAVAPGAPTLGAVTAGSGSATVSWAPPADDGGSTVDGYSVRAYQGATLVTTTPAAASARSVVVPGLLPGTPYTFAVVARNVRGTSTESVRSAAVVPTATAPGAPKPGTVTAGDRSAEVQWSPPTSTGGAPITGYVVRVSTNGQVVRSVTAAATARSIRVDGLTNGTMYATSIAARNAVGTGPEAMANVVFAPRAVERPGAPGLVTVVPGRGSVTVRWAAPVVTGGAPVTGYEIRVYVRGVLQRTVPAAAASRSLVVGNLLPGTAHTFTVTAVNSAGRGAASWQSAAAVPTR